MNFKYIMKEEHVVRNALCSFLHWERWAVLFSAERLDGKQASEKKARPPALNLAGHLEHEEIAKNAT